MLLKHGHLARDVDSPEAEIPRPLARPSARAGARANSWGRHAAPRGTSLYRSPALPVVLGERPHGPAVSIAKYRDDTRDWRKLDPTEVQRAFLELSASLEPSPNPRMYATPFRRDSEAFQRFEGLMAAVAVGTLQACDERLYWAPSYDAPRSVEKTNIRMPMSKLCADSRLMASDGSSLPCDNRGRTISPDRHGLSATAPLVSWVAAAQDACLSATVASQGSADPLPGDGVPRLIVSADVSTLEACRALSAGPDILRIALVRFVCPGDHRGATPAVGDFRSHQLFLCTSYLKAVQEMRRHIHASPLDAWARGDFVYTSDVTILRGPVEEGAAWLEDAPRIDVITVGLQRHPRSDDQGQYARVAEKAAVMQTIDRVLEQAAVHGVDALVFPPLGVGGQAGYHHPPADAGDLLRKAILTHDANRGVRQVWVCREHAPTCHPEWHAFAHALQHGRPQPLHRELVPVAASPYLRPGWEPTGWLARKAALRPSSASLRSSRAQWPPMRWPPGTHEFSSRASSARTPRAEKVRLDTAGRAVVP